MFGDHLRTTTAIDGDSHAHTLDVRLTAALTIIAAVLVAMPVEEPTILRAVAGLPLLLFLPGYAVTAALFPARADSSVTHDSAILHPGVRAVSTVERLVLSVVASVAIVGTAGLLANAVVGVFLVPILLLVVLGTLLASLIAYSERLNLAPNQRYAPLQSLRGSTGRWRPTSAAAWFLLAAAVAGFLVVGASGVAALTATGDGVTEFYVGGETENGTIAMGEHPRSLTVGEPATHYLVVDQHNSGVTNYTIVAQRVIGNGTNASTGEIGRYDLTVPSNDHAVQSIEITLDEPRESVQINYYLYAGDAPSAPDGETAMRTLIVDVSAAES